MSEEILRRVETAWLLSIYGAMLTDKQRAFAALYYDEDLSLAEVAAQAGVSRQCVHEALRRVEKQLRALEGKLSLRQRFQKAQAALEGASCALEDAQRALDAPGEGDAPCLPHIALARSAIENAARLLSDQEDDHGL